ncbi:hypothetical protein GCM10010247_31350 [Streptomyces calvus]|nr:hypothetical protein GCM10010247_31350 [Streptomyces calvus]
MWRAHRKAAAGTFRRLAVWPAYGKENHPPGRRRHPGPDRRGGADHRPDQEADRSGATPTTVSCAIEI